MSNPLAIASVTAALRKIVGLQQEDGTALTAKPPDKAREGQSGKQLNVALYHTEPCAAWRNTDPPWEVKPGEGGHPPLALTLYYLVSAYSDNDDEIAAHRLLGRAMNNLHDHPVLGPEDFTAVPESDLHLQAERVRITPEPLSLDDMFKLWSTFQTQHRPSATYQASVVLIDSGRPATAPLPVVARGREGRGIDARADLLPPFPTLTAVSPQHGQPAVRLGDSLTLGGHHLDGERVRLVLRHPRLPADDEEPSEGEGQSLTPTRTSATTLEATLPEASGAWAAGVCSLSVEVEREGEPKRTSNQLPIVLAPRIDSTSVADGVLTVTVSPPVLATQRALLLLGGPLGKEKARREDRAIPAENHPPAGEAPGPTSTLRFPIAGAKSGEYYVRLRVDGVDSLLVDYRKTPPAFDSDQKVRVPEREP